MLKGCGGMFERMVDSTKKCLRKMIGRAKFTHDELHTAVVEVEGILNSRPISYLSSEDVDDHTHTFTFDVWTAFTQFTEQPVL
jgi:hypothetical protein